MNIPFYYARDAPWFFYLSSNISDKPYFERNNLK